ncbi:hypothetical protein AMK17_30990 [Streptomyces sp. CB00072]|uniref:FAD:protein FMN transferase n=1 Tax=Streptomyces sp. CB00072 TaxID=1703928 RepID=UPI000939A71E|nr:FAD:protein FMN transferase [Streptomyces sp. CB00072]OKI51672.1 hypothetical protein AMK17_30990 [Streptomyces sp. CB00072]
MNPAEASSRFAFDAIGTPWQIETEAPLDQDVRQRILDRAERFDATYSRFRPDSLVSRIASAPEGGRFVFPDDSLALFDVYDRLYAATDGAVDPLVGRDLELLGYDAAYTLRPAPEAVRAEHARDRPDWTADAVRDGPCVLTLRPVVIDVGAVGKGYLVDLLSAVLDGAGHTGFVVDASGDLLHRGRRPTRVGLENPFAARQVIGVAEVRDRALCASGVNRRSWGDGLHHVLDARTAVPADRVVATWVVAERAACADGLATALFFTGADRLAQSFDFTCVRVRSDGRAEISPDFPGELFG